MYRCRKPGCRGNTVLTQLQTRSTDEGMTNYILCQEWCNRCKQKVQGLHESARYEEEVYVLYKPGKLQKDCRLCIVDGD